MHFVISALRAVVEMLIYCLVAQGVLGLLTGGGKERNVIYQLFALINRPWRKRLAILLRRQEDSALVAGFGFIVLLVIWISLAVLRKVL